MSIDLNLAHEQMNIVIVGHVDHGKSTLVGRLLADSGSLPEGKLEHVQAICKRQGKLFEYAFLLDALEAEQDQGITIDSARCFFKTDARDYIIIDAPGHIEFLKNMISGAARAEAAVLLIDAKEGVRENSRRHGYVLSMLGIRQVTVAVNKMDLVDYDQAVFDRIEAEYREFLASCDLTPQRFIPISAREGDNIATASENMPWYTGPTVLEGVDLFAKALADDALPLRLPVQDVYKFNDRGDDKRIIAGRIESGRLSVGDRIVFSPSNKTTTVESIEQFSAPDVSTIGSGRSVGFTVAEEHYIERGEIVSPLDERPRVSTLFRANLFWLGKQPMVPGREYKLKLGTKAIGCRIREIVNVIDASVLDSSLDKNEVGRHDVADLILEAKRPIAFDLTHEFKATGRFVIVDDWDVAGGGIIRDVVDDSFQQVRDSARQRDFEWIGGNITQMHRAERYGHQPAVVLLTGDAGVGKAAIAKELEALLFNDGLAAYLLDAGNVFLGVDQDLRNTMNRDEMVRRYGEVTNLFLDAGHLVISTSNTFGLADHGVIRELVAPDRFVTIHIGPDAPDDADFTVDLCGDAKGCAATVRGVLTELGVIPVGQ